MREEDRCVAFRYFPMGEALARLQHGPNPEHSLMINFHELGDLERPSPDREWLSIGVVEWHRAIVARLGRAYCEVPASDTNLTYLRHVFT
jgi:hypothetical protein